MLHTRKRNINVMQTTLNIYTFLAVPTVHSSTKWRPEDCRQTIRLQGVEKSEFIVTKERLNYILALTASTDKKAS